MLFKIKLMTRKTANSEQTIYFKLEILAIAPAFMGSVSMLCININEIFIVLVDGLAKLQSMLKFCHQPLMML